MTGEKSGIGAATAATFAEYGAAVVVTDANDDLGHGVAEKITVDGGQAIYPHLDTSDESQ